MRIALVHSYYSSRQPSGENVVVDAQATALAAAGHDVTVVARRTDDRERRRTYPIEAAWTVATGAGPDPTEELRRFRPDVVHVHNLFPNFGTRWLAAWPGPVVATLHNFRPMCAAGTLYRDGASCTACPDGDPMAAVRHGCYRGSRVATLPMVIGRRGGVTWDPLVRRSDALIVLTDSARNVYQSYGVDGARLHVVPNFVDDPYGAVPRAEPNGRWMLVGRLSPEKGIEELLRVWPADVGLDIYGSGELADRLARTVGPMVTLMGAVDRTRIRTLMPQYTGLVFPSRWPEGLPTVLLEAMAAGLPTVAVDANSVSQCLIQHGLGGVVPIDANRQDWAARLATAARDRPALSVLSRAVYEAHFAPRHWTSAISELYSAITPHRWAMR